MIVFLLLAFSAAQDFSDHQEEGCIGEDLELSCEYPKGGHENKFLCKGEDPDTCEHLVNSSMPDLNSEKFRFEDSKDRLNVTISNITAGDEGTYLFGCGNVTEHGNKSEIVCKRRVRPGLKGPPLAAPLPEASSFLSIVSLCVCVAVLVLLVVVIVLIRKGMRRNDAPPQTNRQEEVQSPTARRAVTAAYATDDPCEDSLHYVTVGFGRRGNTSEPEPSSSHCLYSTVFNKRADTCTVQEASSEEPLYCNVNRKY